MTIQERIAKGEYLVKNHYDVDGKNGHKIGDDYYFNLRSYKVKEVCEGELDGLLWIGL